MSTEAVIGSVGGGIRIKIDPFLYFFFFFLEDVDSDLPFL